MGAQIAKHNQKLLRQYQGGQQNHLQVVIAKKSRRKDCPILGACNQDGVVYQASVTNNKGEVKSYVGLAKILKTITENIKTV